MTIAGALAATGGFFVFAAISFGVFVDESHGRTSRLLSTLGWAAFALAIGFFLAAAWTAALT